MPDLTSQTPQSMQPCGWYGSIGDFLSISKDRFLASLEDYHQKHLREMASTSQISAWDHSFQVLQAELERLGQTVPSALKWTIIFEYELPRERGRRPDVILLGPGTIYVIEFKDFTSILQAHVDQVDAYARDINHYHAASHDCKVIPILLLTQARSLHQKQDQVDIISPDELVPYLASTQRSDQPLINAIQWLNADYAPLPSLVAAARTLFRKEPLPQIRRAQSAGIPDTVAHLLEIAKQARSSGERHLALVTGVPGAGKTLVGIQLVYENSLDRKVTDQSAVFLSGNGPLVKVLQHALKNKIFVQDVHGFLMQYGGSMNAVPQQHILIFDEAQRAWDLDRSIEKRGSEKSEPEDFLHLAEKMSSWAMMIALIGEGQEIHIGEEAGLVQWNDALEKMKQQWTVHCPTKIASLFSKSLRVIPNDKLDLTMTLRSHLAEDIAAWVELLIGENPGLARERMSRIYAQGFDIYLTRDLNLAKNYVRQRYEGQEDKRYGLIASSKAKNLVEYEIHVSYNFTKKLRVGEWYNDNPTSKWSCCKLHDVATEFQCQGLELDYPIVCWGKDLRWVDDKWKTPRTTSRNQAKDPHRLRMNSYRVLLTRGRDGFIIFIPDEPQMQSTYDLLRAVGIRELPSAITLGEKGLARASA
ncbi:MAG: DUF2075 domain-containing protein [Methanomicrobiales archaeon]|nr:DUF2075 domain-containing protein [Methanomicrobiales archaeon]